MRIWKRFLPLLVGAAMIAAGLLPAPVMAAVNWQADPTRPQFYNLNAVTYGNQQFVAAGDHGMIMTSPDGERWQVRRTGGATESIASIAYGNGRYLATPGPYNDIATVLTSTDGTTWEQQPVPGFFPAVTFCDGEFWAAVGYPAGLAHSRDGITWQTERLPKDEFVQLNRVACGGGSVVAITGGHDVPVNAIVTYQPAGATPGWTRQTLADVSEMYDVAYGGDRFVILGYGGGAISTSIDGKTWSRSSEPVSGSLTRLAYGNGRWAALSFSGGATSTDGLTWQERYDQNLGGYGLGGGLAYGDGRFVAVSIKGYTALSTDGLAWKVPAEGVPRYDTGLVFAHGLFVAVGQGGNGGSVVSISEDGRTWESVRLTTGGQPMQLLYDEAGQRFLALVTGEPTGSDFLRRSLYTSADGRTWQGPVALPDRIMTIAEAEGQYLAVAIASDDLRFSDGTPAAKVVPAILYRSRDLLTWEGTPAPAGMPTSLAYGGGTYALTEQERTGEPYHIAGYPVRNFLYTSTDGRQWTRRDESVARTIYCGGRFVEANGRSSADGITWTDYVPGSGAGGWNLGCSGGLVFGQTGNSVLTVSADGGRTWGQLEPALGAELTAAALGNGRLVAVGSAPVASTLRCGDLLDVASADPACGAIKELVARGVLGGFPGGLMKPEESLTRAQLAKMLVLTLGGSPEPSGTLPFADTVNHWATAQGWLQAVQKLGAIDGYPDGTFRPDGPVTRAELIKLAAAAAGLAEGTSLPLYEDVPVDGWYAAWVRKALAARIIGPKAPTPLWKEPLLQPDRPATRAEAAILLTNLPRRGFDRN